MFFFKIYVYDGMLNEFLICILNLIILFFLINMFLIFFVILLFKLRIGLFFRIENEIFMGF